MVWATVVRGRSKANVHRSQNGELCGIQIKRRGGVDVQLSQARAVGDRAEGDTWANAQDVAWMVGMVALQV